MKKLILVVITLLIAAGVGFGLYSMISDATAPEEMISVAVLKKDVEEGHFLTSADYDYVSIPSSEYIPSYVVMQRKEVLDEATGKTKVEIYDSLKGKEVVSPMYVGERLNKSRVRFSNEMADEMEFSNKDYKRYTYSGTGLNNFAGLLKSGDRVDIWLQYTITAKGTGTNDSDKIIVTDKIFTNVLISRVLDGAGNEVTTSSGEASVLEFMMTEEDIQKFISWRAIGTATLVKSGKDSSDSSISRKIISMNELVSTVVEDAENTSLLNPNLNYQIDDSVNDFNND